MRGFLLILGILVLLAAAAAGFFWWKVSTLKQQLVSNLSTTLNANVQVSSFDLDVWKGEVHAAGLSFDNRQPDAPWDSAQIDQATGYFHVMDVLSPTLPMRIAVTGWKVSLHTMVASGLAPGSDAASTSITASPAPEESPAGNDRFRVTSISGTQGEVAVRVTGNDPILVHGVMFNAETHGGPAWTTDLQCSSVAAGTLATGAGSVHLQSDSDKITFSDLSVHCGDGQITGNGDLDLGGMHAIHGTFNANLVPVAMLVAARWQMKFSGFATGNLIYQSDDATATANGKFSLSGARLNLLPWLGKVTSLVGLPDITGVELDQATADFSWKNHALTLSNIDIRKTDVLRIAGSVDVSAGGACDGRLKLGLPSAVTARWPKLQAEVFSTPMEDYNWADVHVTGTPDALQEDLTPRLLAVGAEQGTDLLKQGGQKAMDLLNGILK